ncbi:MAG: FGGY-family carbohydrate kinase, partial [Aestuariivirgaceae bacterium]|nr:FGGY-family carbohydrate kinase [Aestuariivirgaceae bacterium]
GVAFAFKDSFNALAAAGTNVTRLMAVGGGSRSDLWLKIIATVLGVPVHVPVKGDFGAAFGAARLAMIAATGASWSSILKKPEFAKTFKPEAKAVDAYARRYETYKKLYPALKEAMQ